MITAGIKELKNQLSRYMAMVKKKENSRGSSLRLALQPLVLKGQVIMPMREIRRDIPAPIRLPGRMVSEIVLEDRR